MPKAFVVDDDRDTRDALAERLTSDGFDVVVADAFDAASRELGAQQFDLVLLDLEIPGGDGLQLFDLLKRNSVADVVFITGHGTLGTAVEAFRRGAADYLTKPVDLERLDLIVRALLRRLAMSGQITALRGELRRLGRFGGLVGASEPMQQVYNLIEQVAPTDATVLVMGETGTGKDLVAQAVHALSGRSGREFVPINCGAISPTLIESELFGHERGSFTGADRMRRGVFEKAAGGTLFLDEITEMSTDLQVRLLRVLETGNVTRVGGEQVIATDFRLVAATNRDPRQAVADGKLREDLLYRLLVFPIELPALRDRGDDVELLARHFLETQNEQSNRQVKLTDAALDVLRRHTWPGNVRELMHVIERAFIVSTDRITVRDLPLESAPRLRTRSTGTETTGDVQANVGKTIREVERDLILSTLEHVAGNKHQAAKLLGISVKTLYSRLSVYHAETPARGEA
jgi:two-component system response regulator AtoC